MARFTPQKFDLNSINGGERFENGQIPEENAFNAPIEMSAYAAEISEEANAKASQALEFAFGSVGTFSPLTAYPIGSIYISINDTSPAVLLGGDWEKVEDCFLFASGDIVAGTTGGSKKITKANLPSGITGILATYSNGNKYGIFPNSADSMGGVFTPIEPDNPATNAAYPTTVQEGISSKPYRGINFDLGGNDSDYMPPYLAVNVWQRIG